MVCVYWRPNLGQVSELAFSPQAGGNDEIVISFCAS